MYSYYFLDRPKYLTNKHYLSLLQNIAWGLEKEKAHGNSQWQI